MAAFPISLIPTFFVPLFILVHLLIFRSCRSRSIGLALNRRLAEGRMNPWRSSQHGAPNDIVVAMRKPGILLPAYDRETASLAGRTFRIRHRHNAVDEVSDALNEASMERTTTTFLDLRRMVLRLSRSQLLKASWSTTAFASGTRPTAPARPSFCCMAASATAAIGDIKCRRGSTFGRRVLLIDSRGHGRNTRDSRRFTYEMMAADVLAVMDALTLEKAPIVGWSDGAWLCKERSQTIHQAIWPK